MKPHKLLGPLAVTAALAAPLATSAQPAKPPAPAATAQPASSATAAATAQPSAQPTSTETAPSAPPPGNAAPSGTARAEPDDEGRAHFQRGVVLFRESDFRGALVEFKRSLEISDNYKVLYNIGQTQFELQDYAGALRSFRKYLDRGGAEIDPARRSQVEADLTSLSARVARVDVKSNTDGAEVLVDDVPVGKTPLAEPVLVSIGRRKIALQKDGVASTSRVLDLAGGDRTALTIDLHDVKSGEPEGPSRTGVWVSLAVTGGLIAGAAVVGGLALSAHSDAQKKLDTFGAKSSDIDSARSKTQTLALVADILGGTAIAMAGVTIVLAVTSGKSNSPPAAPKSATLTLGPRGVTIGGAF